MEAKEEERRSVRGLDVAAGVVDDEVSERVSRVASVVVELKRRKESGWILGKGL